MNEADGVQVGRKESLQKSQAGSTRGVCDHVDFLQEAKPASLTAQLVTPGSHLLLSSLFSAYYEALQNFQRPPGVSLECCPFSQLLVREAQFSWS